MSHSSTYWPIIFILTLMASMASKAEPAESDRQGPPRQDGWRLSVGGGSLTVPDYPGSDSYRNRVIPFVSARYEDRFEFSFRGAQLNVLPSDSRWKAGPVTTYQSGRTNRGAISEFDDVSGGPVAGGFVEYRLGPAALSVRAENAVTGDISGSRASMSMDFNQVLGGRWLLGYSLGTTWHSDNWSSGLYGVSAGDAAASAQPAYDPASGFTDINAGVRATFLFNRQWSATAFARASRLTGDAADSPTVSELGRRSQGFVAAVLSYTF